jgi:hypothetical protein
MPQGVEHAMLGEHGAALVVLPYLAVAVLALLMAVEIGARAGSPAAIRLRSAYLATPSAVRLAALGMTISAAVHLVLVPGHLTGDPMLGVLFALDGAALVAAAVWSLTRPLRGWRTTSLVLLLGGVLAYAWYLATGRETADAVGIATKVVELAAIGLLLLPSRIGSARRSRRGPMGPSLSTYSETLEV